MSESETGHTPGPWAAYNMVGPDGSKLSPEEIGEYVTKAVRNGDPDRFLFVQQHGADDVDICHVGNGPDGPYNAHLIAAAPQMLAALREARNCIQGIKPWAAEDLPPYCTHAIATIDAALAKAGGQKE